MSDREESSTVDLVAAGLSVAREKILEQRLLSELAVLMLRRGVTMDVLRSEYDAQGHDVVLESAGVIRHLQLKATVDGGKRRDVDINVRLRAKLSGCVAWMSYDPSTLAITAYRWFGAEPGEPLPDLGTKVTKHSKGDGVGTKAQRPALRNLPKSRFEKLAGLEALADRLFGPVRSVASSLVLAQLRERFGTNWRAAVANAAVFTAFNDAIEAAHLIDGYRVLEQLCELDPPDWLERMAEQARSARFNDDLGLLWTQLFLEHRRWRFASPFEPSADELRWLDELAVRTGAAFEQQVAAASA
jgi:hypothetical protein